MTFKVLLHHYGSFTSPPGRKFVDGIVATVDLVELNNFSTNQMKAILTKCLGYDENSSTFLYMKKPNRSLDSGLVLLDDAIQDIDSILTYIQTYQNLLHVYVSRVELSPLVMADQLEDGVTGKIQIYVSHHPIDLSTELIPNDGSLEEAYAVAGKIQIYVSHHLIDLSTVLILNDGSLEEAFAGIISEETKIKQQESLRYLHQMQKQYKRFDYYEFLGKLRFIDKIKPTTSYTQTIFNLIVHSSGKLVIDATKIMLYVNGGKMNITVPRIKLEEMKQYLFNIIGKNIHALYYKLQHTGFLITVKLRNNYDMHVMFDISSAQWKLKIYIDHVGVNFVIAKYICPNATLAEIMNHVITDYTSDNEDERNEVTQTDYTYDHMVEWAEHEHFEYEENKQV
ncbi:hypothetical protein Tco_0871977 [Tanacetum coccineum]